MRFVICVLSFFSLSVLQTSFARGEMCITPWGMPVMEGQFVIAYFQDRPEPGMRCQSEMRFCNNGMLSGFYLYQNCIERWNGLGSPGDQGSNETRAAM